MENNDKSAVKVLEELFMKTTTEPKIYFKPLSEEEVLQKLRHMGKDASYLEKLKNVKPLNIESK